MGPPWSAPGATRESTPRDARPSGVDTRVDSELEYPPFFENTMAQVTGADREIARGTRRDAA